MDAVPGLDLLLGGVASFLAAVLLGRMAIPLLRRLRVGQRVRDDGPPTHLKKEGTPTMGGLFFVLPGLAVATILFPRDEKVLAAVAFAVVFAAVGFVDDFLKVVRRRPLGLRARYKLAVQVPAAVALGLFASRGLASTVVAVPFGGPRLELGYLYLALAVGWAVFFGNAVNITDGADGLLPGAMIPSLCAYLLVALAGGHRGLAVLCSALAGACLGFLVYNRYPAQVIMGDTGSLGLGGTLTALALLTRTELLLVLVGLVYAVEALSVIMQVISFRTTGRRIFRMSPLHHHFELLGWPEGKVVKLFWLLAAVSALLGLLGLVGMGPLS